MQASQILVDYLLAAALKSILYAQHMNDKQHTDTKTTSVIYNKFHIRIFRNNC